MNADALFSVSTPSPSNTLYPFASTHSISSVVTPPQTGTIQPNPSNWSNEKPPRNVTNRLRHLTDQRPLARASNPMLAASYKAQASSNLVSASKLEDGEGKKLDKFERDFTLIQSLGGGAFSRVWKVRDKVSGGLWAVKAGKPYTGHKNRYVPTISRVCVQVSNTDPVRSDCANLKKHPFYACYLSSRIPISSNSKIHGNSKIDYTSELHSLIVGIYPNSSKR